MFNENLKAARKAKGFTQEELAIKVNVVRQTVSKWEKGLSVPDAETLSQIADVLEVNVSELLGSQLLMKDDRNELAEQLAKISEQMAIKNRRAKTIWKVISILLIVIFILSFLVTGMGYLFFSADKHTGNTTYYEEYDTPISNEDTE